MKIKINKYWFKKRGKKGMMPITWEGWAFFTLFIGFITQVYRFVDGFVPICLVCFIIAVVYFKLGELKTDPNEIYNKEKDRIRLKQVPGILAGVIVSFAIFLGIFMLWINYQHSIAGTVTRPNGENGWMEFQAKNDNFTIEVPSYPKYSVTNKPIANTNVILKISSYESKVNNVEDYSIAITELPESGNYSDVSLLFSNTITGMTNNLKSQTKEDPTINSSPLGTFLSYPSETFSAEGIKNDYRVEGMAFLANKKLYLLFYANDKEHFSENDYSHLINSMKFIVN
jgi:hypothetical protein